MEYPLITEAQDPELQFDESTPSQLQVPQSEHASPLYEPSLTVLLNFLSYLFCAYGLIAMEHQRLLEQCPN